MANSAQRTQHEILAGVDTNDLPLAYLNLVLDILGTYYANADVIPQNPIRETIRRIEAAASRNSTAAVLHFKQTLNTRAEQLDPRA